MTIIQLPPDGAEKRFRAAQENAMADKTELVEKSYNRIDSLKKKVQAGDVLKSFKAHPGFTIMHNYCESTWAFKLIMNEMKNNKTDPEAYKQMMVQRDAIETLFNWIDRGIQLGDEARKQLAEEEKK